MRHLIIESRPSRRRELLRLLDVPRDDILILDDFSAALQWLRSPNAPVVRTVILGWPAHTDNDADAILAWLSQPDQLDTAVILLADSPLAAGLSWSESRPNGALLLWSERERLMDTLRLLLRETDVPPAPATPPSARILLVDDSPTARFRFRRLLADAGHQVVPTGAIDEALQLASSRPFDLAILDFFMPRMRGSELCARLQQLPATHRPLCIILTAGYSDKVIQASLAAGAVDCLFKNEAEALFLARIATHVRDVHLHQDMQAKHHHLQGILASVGDGVYGVDRAGRITYVNPAVVQLLGYPEARLLAGVTPAELFHVHNPNPTSAAKTDSQLRKAIEQGQSLTFESRFLRADGNTIDVELTIQPLEIAGRREGAVVAFRDITERKRLEKELKWQATHDPLTRLCNRSYLHDALEHEIQRLKRTNETSVLLYLDLDRFKYINDTIGHTAGDRLLIELADALNSRVRQSDLLARIGGDEFALLLHNIPRDRIFAIAEEYRRLLETFTFQHEGRIYSIHGSIGVARVDRDATSPDAVLSAADLACHIAKGKGRNMTHVYENEDRKHTMDRDLGWLRRLKRAVKKNAFELAYQPIVSLHTLNLDRAPADPADFQIWLQEQAVDLDIIHECLLRLRDRRGQLISPNAFLPTAERFNLMADIDRWVLDTAMTQLETAHQHGHALQLSVNLSGQCMSKADMMTYLRQRLATLAAPTDHLLLEITESCAIRHLPAARSCIEALSRDRGVRFAIDDFGTGYSTLAQLKNLPVHFIKIDGQFIRDIRSDPTDMAIVRSIVQIAHTAGKRTVAEYVESLDVLKRLQACGVDYAQGYFLSPPRLDLPRPPEPDHQRVVEIVLPRAPDSSCG